MMRSDPIVKLLCGHKSRFSLLRNLEREYEEKDVQKVGYICAECANKMKEKGIKIKRVNSAYKIQ